MEIENLIQTKTNSLSRHYRYDKKTWISISNIKDFIKLPFERDAVAERTSNKYFDDESSEYYHKTKDDIIQMWETKALNSRTNGTFCDDYIGMCFEHKNPNIINDWKTKILNEHQDMQNKFIGIDNCLQEFNSNNFNFVCREKKLILPYTYKGKTYIINGRFDALFQATNDVLTLIDWKNSEDIKTENRWQSLLGPCDFLDDCDINLFSVQLYFYKYILEKVYEISVPIKPYIIQFPSFKDYYFKVYKPSFDYDEKLIEEIIEFCIEEKEKGES